MFRNEQGERRWAVLAVPLLLCGSPIFAIFLNHALPSWSFLRDEIRNLIFVLMVPFILGVASETWPVMVGEDEARDGTLVFAAIVLIGWFLLAINGWALGIWINLLPIAFFVSQVSAFHAGRWIGRIPGPKLPDRAGEA